MLEPYDVRKLPEDGETVEATLDAKWLGEICSDLGDQTLGLAPVSDGVATIRLRAVAGMASELPTVRITGQARAPFRIECVRCLTPLDLPLECELDLTLFPETPPENPRPAAGAPAAETRKTKTKVEKVELSSPQLDEGGYRGFELDLPELVREALLLEVDMNPACPDLGACEARVLLLTGGSGNPEPEAAEAPGIDPRWAPLQKFRLKSS